MIILEGFEVIVQLDHGGQVRRRYEPNRLTQLCDEESQAEQTLGTVDVLTPDVGPPTPWRPHRTDRPPRITFLAGDTVSSRLIVVDSDRPSSADSQGAFPAVAASQPPPSLGQRSAKNSGVDVDLL